MSNSHTSARDLSGVLDDEAHTPMPGSAARRTSPSPIRGRTSGGAAPSTSGTPARHGDPSQGQRPPLLQPHEVEMAAISPAAQQQQQQQQQQQLLASLAPYTPPSGAASAAAAARSTTSNPPAAQASGGKNKFSLAVDVPDPNARRTPAPPTREEVDAARGAGQSSTRALGSRYTDAGATLLPSGKLQVRVVRDGKTSVEEMEPNELAHLYAQQQAALRKMQGQMDFLTVPDWVRLHPMLGPYLAEATGTFAWVLTLSLTSIRNRSIFNTADDTNVTCLPIGFMFTSMVFTFGYISGGHFNPAISLAVFLIRKMDLVRCLGYIICQVAAAFGAGVVAMLIQGNTDIFVPSVSNSFVSSGIFAELIYTFAIALVVLNTGYSRQSGNFFYGFAIGMTMAAGSASVGHISGGAFNPAAATGLQLSLCMTGSCDDLKSFWIYWLAPLVGAVVASLIYSQMYQPIHTQVLQDHKVLRDPAKELMQEPAADGASGAASRDGDGEDRRTADDEVGGDASGSDSESSRNRRRREGSAAALEDSLAEPVAPRRGRDREREVSTMV